MSKINIDRCIPVLKAAGLSILLIFVFRLLNLMYATAIYAGLVALAAYLVINRARIPGWIESVKHLGIKNILICAAVILAIILLRKIIPTFLIWGIILGIVLLYAERYLPGIINSEMIRWMPVVMLVYALLSQNYFSIFMCLTTALAFGVYKFAGKRI